MFLRRPPVLYTEHILQIDEEDPLALQTGHEATTAMCDLIALILHIFLLHSHSHLKSQRLGVERIHGFSSGRQPSPMLQPVIDLLQYQGFCESVKAEVNKMVKALGAAGVPCGLRINSVGENGKELVKLLSEDDTRKIGGEIILRIHDRCALLGMIVMWYAEWSV
jgi:mediator of RNA polymerase II transcription subunit 17